MSIYQPYTYLIGWTHLNKFYYGVRYAQGCHPNDLWKTYFTSSKHVETFREEYGEPDIIEIRRTFETQKAAQDWETKVLQRINAVKEERFLNKACGGVIEYDIETRNKMSNAAKNRIGKKNSMFGKKHSEETKLKIGEAGKGRKHLEESKAKMRGPRGKQRKIICEKCGESITLNMFTRKHINGKCLYKG